MTDSPSSAHPDPPDDASEVSVFLGDGEGDDDDEWISPAPDSDLHAEHRKRFNLAAFGTTFEGGALSKPRARNTRLMSRHIRWSNDCT
jgi:hypothetical protein